MATATELEQRISSFANHNAAADEEFNAILALAREIDPDHRESAPLLLDAVKSVGRSAQARGGQLIQLLAQADRVKAHRAGLSTWLATTLDVSAGRARGITESAQRIGDEPVLARVLSSGDIGSDTIRALTRTARAIAYTSLDKSAALTATLDVATREGPVAARRHVRILEETLDPGRAERLLARQRRRSFARMLEVESGMVRFDVLLDPERATTMRAAIDLCTAEVIRARQSDHEHNNIPADVRTTEQVHAHAMVRCAEVYLTADPEVRGAHWSMPVLFYVSLFPDGAKLAESVYGDLIPPDGLPSLETAAARLVEYHDAHPERLNGQVTESDRTARLTGPGQRTTLAHRGRPCAYPGCTRPPIWGLHAHHDRSHSHGGQTNTENLAPYCAEHHTLMHSEQHDA